MSSTGVVCGQEGLLPVSFRGGAFTEFFALLRIFEFCVVGGDLVHICRKNICLIAFCQWRNFSEVEVVFKGEAGET